MNGQLHTTLPGILLCGVSDMKRSKNLIPVLVFIGCIGIGWFLRSTISTGVNGTTEAAMPDDNPQTLAQSNLNNRTDPAEIAKYREMERNPNRINTGSKSLPKFRYDYTIETKKEVILEKTRGLHPSSPQFSPDGKRIIFSAGTEGSHDLWLIDRTGGNLTRLTSGASDDIDPAWMSDGARVVYSSNASGTYELYMIDAAGGTNTRITSDGTYKKTHPRCSPIIWMNHGKESTKESIILYQAENDGRIGIWVVGEDGAFPSEIVAPSQQDENYIQPEWSPNSLTCVYTCQSNSKTTVCAGWNAVTYYSDYPVLNFRKLSIEGNAEHPVFFPNGTKLTYVTPGQDSQALWYAATDGSGARKLALRRAIRGGIAWSPDGSGFAYTSTVNSDDCLIVQDIYCPLQNVANLWQYAEYAPEAVGLLEKNRFAVMTTEHNLFPQLYEQYCRYYGTNYRIPVFITVDSSLELFHLFFDYTLRTVEEQKLLPVLRDMLDGCLSAANTLPVTGNNQIMKGDKAFLIDYFTVARNLLAPVSTPASNTAAQEIELINKSQGAAISPVMKYTIDYSLFAVRGHYTHSDSLSRYFKAMTWLGQASFSADNKDNPEKAAEDTRRALLLTRLMAANANLMTDWNRLYEPILLFTGGADDLTIPDYQRLMKGVYTAQTVDELYNMQKLNRFIALLKQEKAPRIVPQDGRSFRFMPQRFTPDSYILQNLVYPKVGTSGNPRLLPRGLDIMAALGSWRAYEILDKVLGETRYERYGTQVNALRKEFSQVGDEEWLQNIYWGWLYTLKGLLPDFTEPYPPFMRTAAWRDKSLSTALASWTELRHDTIMYVKQTGAEAGEGGEGWAPVIPKPKGYVEPNPEFYRRLNTLLTISYGGLKERNLLSGEIADKTDKFRGIVSHLETIARKELSNTPLSDEDYDFIIDYGSELEYLTIFFNEGESTYTITEGDVALIADVATDRINNTVLHEAVGKVREMDVVTPLEGRNQITRGGVFTYYEFTEKGKRLNDDDWKRMVKEKTTPLPPVWTKSYSLQ
jgi:Tol biopolymer transport system component